MPSRTAGQYGRRKPDLTRPALRLGNYLTGAVPAHPAAADYLAAMNGGWKMLGNDTAGDCVAVTWANMRRLVSRFLSAAEDYPPQSWVWEVYKTQNPDFDPNGTSDTNGPGSGADQGMDIQTLLGYLVKTGGPDGVKALGFAKVDHTNPAEVKAAIALFGAVWTGINVQASNQDEFGSDEPWTWQQGEEPEGGHSVLTGGYAPQVGNFSSTLGSQARAIYDYGYGPVTLTSGSDPALGGDERFITWAAETSFTDEFWANGVEECWVVIWPEHLGSAEFCNGVDLTALAADYTALTGKPFPAEVPPPPAPTPTPSPTPADADSTLWQTAGPWCAQTRTRPDLVALKAALVQWAEAKGQITP